MKKLILGIIAVFLVEIAFISYSKLSVSDEPEVAVAKVPEVPAGPAFRYGREVKGLTGSAESGLELLDISVSRPRREKVARDTLPRRRSGHEARRAPRVSDALSARVMVRKPRQLAVPQPGYRTVVERQYFGSTVVEVTYRVYDFQPSNPRLKRPTFIA